MILDHLDNHASYLQLNPRFRAAFEFLADPKLADLPNGRHDLLGDELFVIIDRTTGKGREKAMLEYHEKYIDIQYVIGQTDEIGWLHNSDCRRIVSPFDTEKDLGFYFDRPSTWLSVPAGSFAIFFPHDAHAPLGCEGEVHKAVVKVAVG